MNILPPASAHTLYLLAVIALAWWHFGAGGVQLAARARVQQRQFLEDQTCISDTLTRTPILFCRTLR